MLTDIKLGVNKMILDEDEYYIANFGNFDIMPYSEYVKSKEEKK